MEIKEYLDIVFRRKWVVLITTIVTIGVVIAGTLFMTPIYQATTTLRLATASYGSLDYIGHDINYTDRLANTYAKIATSQPLLDELDKSLGIAKPPTIKVDVSTNTELIQITVEDPNPALAASAANKAADLLVAYAKASDSMGDKTAQQTLNEQLSQALNEVNKAQSEYTSLATQTPAADGIAAAAQLLKVKQDTYATLLALNERVQTTQSVLGTTLSVIEPAAIPDSPSQPKKPLNIALGLLVGIVGGLGLAFLLENLDSTLYTVERIGKVTEQPILGKIPNVDLRISSFLNGTSPAGEAFRHVRTSLLNLNHGSSPNSLLVTSAAPGEGKTTVATNLAYTLAQSGRKVLLVDCDLRLPTLNEVIGVPDKVGLSGVLTKGAALNDAVQYEPRSGIWVLTSGGRPDNPSELLSSSGMANLIKQASELYDVLVFDAPSLLAVTDAAVLAPISDVVVLVVAQARVREDAVKSACRILLSTNAKKIGVIVNRTNTAGEYRYYTKHDQPHRSKPSQPPPEQLHQPKAADTTRLGNGETPRKNGSLKSQLLFYRILNRLKKVIHA